VLQAAVHWRAGAGGFEGAGGAPGKSAPVRDLVAREALRNLAEEASDRFRELVRSGEEVPYEVREPSEGSPLCAYAPLTDRFIGERTALIARLDAFGPAKAAIVSAGLATPYLESRGVVLAPSEGRRAEDTIVAFLCRLWDGRSDFAFERSRTDEAITELEECAEEADGEVEVVVPVIGLRMSASRLDLTTATIVRSDVVEAPPEAVAPDGSGRAGWEPQFLAFARCMPAELGSDVGADGEPAAGSVAERFRILVTALRLFKPGGVGLGPHGWVRLQGGRWRRISTGAGRPRSGAYQLADSELGALAGLSRALERGSGRPAGLDRAISRFEAGLDRAAVLEALNDHLLALRFLLEGDGPAKTEMSLRIAALCAGPGERDGVRATIERALALERELWSGDPAPSGDGRAPVEIAGAVEDFTRAILRDAACGHLGADLRATADEILLADGLAAGEGDASRRGETSEWDLGEHPEITHTESVEVEPEAESAPRARDPQTIELESVDEPIAAELSDEPIQPQLSGAVDDVAEPDQGPERPQPQRPRRPRDGWIPFVVSDPEESVDLDDGPVEANVADSGFEEPAAEAGEESEPERGRRSAMEPAPAYEDWLAESGRGETLDFPKRERGPAMRLLDQRPEERKAIRERVSNLFPAPETTDWSVSELDCRASRRANA
jgi:hypothetical protein